jgi:hypothetical protein
MSDFLKNLRSSQSRDPDGNRKGYECSFYPQTDRRSYKERRVTPQSRRQTGLEELTPKIAGLIPEIKDFLTDISETQQRIAKACERRADSEERRLRIAEEAVETLRQFFSTGITSTMAMNTDPESLPRVAEAKATRRMATKSRREEVIGKIKKMRGEGMTYDQIAITLGRMNIPTFSNRGAWHAQTIHRLCQEKR